MRHVLSLVLAATMALAVTAPAHAQGMSAHRAGDRDRHETDGRHDRPGHEHDRDGHHGRAVFRGPFVYWNPYPVYVQPTPGYWYYCPSAEAYYPYVTYCLDAWVPVPAQ